MSPHDSDSIHVCSPKRSYSVLTALCVFRPLRLIRSGYIPSRFLLADLAARIGHVTRDVDIGHGWLLHRGHINLLRHDIRIGVTGPTTPHLASPAREDGFSASANIFSWPTSARTDSVAKRVGSTCVSTSIESTVLMNVVHRGSAWCGHFLVIGLRQSR